MPAEQVFLLEAGHALGRAVQLGRVVGRPVDEPGFGVHQELGVLAVAEGLVEAGEAKQKVYVGRLHELQDELPLEQFVAL